jgi:hypothetical protein
VDRHSRGELKIGSTVKFHVTPDSRRENGFNAYSVETVGMLIPSGVDLHIDAREIDNPGVPMRWCFTPETHRRITDGLAQGYGYAVLLVGKKRGDIFATREVREVHTWNQPFTIFTFGAPGEWDVAALLYESKDVCTKSFRTTSEQLELDMRRRFLHKQKESHRIAYGVEFEDLHGLSYSEYWPRYWVNSHRQNSGMPIAMSLLSVTVPKEIFAPEPSPAMKAYANYFFRYQLSDQCDYRRRFLLMIPGFVPWILIEGGKRLFWLLLGIASLCAWLEITPAFLMEALRPAVKLGWPDRTYTSTENGRMWPFNKKPLQWFVPCMLALYWTVLHFLVADALPYSGRLFARHHEVVTTASSWGTALLLVIVFGGGLIYLIKKRLDSTLEIRAEKQLERLDKRTEERQQMAKKRGRREAAFALEYAPVLVCGDAPTQVSLKAIPAPLRSTHMLFAAVKQQVCRPFAR